MRVGVAVIVGLAVATVSPAAAGAAGWTTVPGTPSATAGTTAEVPSSVAVDPQGNLWLAFSEISGGVGQRLHVYERSPGGTFVSVFDEAEPNVGPPLVAAGADGTVAVAFETNVSVPEVMIRPPGGSFGAPVQAASNPSSFVWGLTVLPDGTALVAWRDGVTPNFHLHVASLKAGGSLVDETPSGIGSDPSVPRLVSNASGEAVVAWNDSPTSDTARIAFSERPPEGAFAAAQGIASHTLSGSETSQINDLDGVALGDAGDLVVTAGFSVSTSAGATNTLRVHTRAAGQASFQHATLDTSTTGPAVPPSSAVTLTSDGTASVVWIGIGGALYASHATAAGGFAFAPKAQLTGLVAGTCLDGIPTGTILLAPLAAGGGVAGLYSNAPFTQFCSGSPLTPIAPGIAGSAAPPSIEPLGTSASSLVPDAHGDAFAAVGFNPEQAAVPVVAYDATPPTLSAISVPALVAAGKPAALSVSASDAISGVAVAWAFGDGGTGAGTAVTHTWAKPGSYVVTATATDGAGNTASAAPLTVVVKDTTPPVLSGVSVKRKTVHFKLSEKATVKLTITRKHHKRHTLTRRGLGAGKRSVSLAKLGLAPGRYTLTLVATDSAGNRSRTKVVRFVLTTNGRRGSRG